MDEFVLLYFSNYEEAEMDLLGLCLCLHYGSGDLTLVCPARRAAWRSSFVPDADGASGDLFRRHDSGSYETEEGWINRTSGGIIKEWIWE